MALADTVNEEVGDDEDELDDEDEDEEGSDSEGGSFGGGGASGGAGLADTVTESSKPTSESVQAEGDKAYFSSFGQGSFTPNQYGGLTFTPASSKSGGNGTGGGTSKSPASIDPQTMLPAIMASPTGRQQIRNLRQLAAAAKALKNVPEQMKMRVLSHLLGVGYQNPQDAAIQRTLMGAAYRQQLAAPGQALKAQQAAESLGLRRAGLQSQEQSRQALQDIREQNLGLRGQSMQDRRQANLDRARASIDSRIGSLTRALSAIPDQNSDVATELHKRLLTLHKQAAQFDKLAGGGKDEGNGNGSSEPPPGGIAPGDVEARARQVYGGQ